LVIFILLIVLIGLDLASLAGNQLIGILAISLISLAMVAGLGWLIYLTIGGVSKYCENSEQ